MRISDWSSDVCSSDLTWRTECLRNKLDDCLKARHPVCRSPVPVRLLANNNVRQLPESTFASLNGGKWTKPPIRRRLHPDRSEEHTSELQSLMRISYAVFCLQKKKEQSPEKYYTKIVQT